MAKTAAEYQREYRERKAKAARLAGDPTDRLPGKKFFEYVNETDSWSEVETYLDWLEIDSSAWPQFKDDEDTGFVDTLDDEDEPTRGSIGRAERMVGLFLDAASETASIVNNYKKQKIDLAIKEIEDSDMTDPTKRKQALKDIVRLNRYREKLEKNVRWEIPQWKLTE